MTIFGANETTETSPDARRLGLIRLSIGVAQGIALYLLYLSEEANAWPSTVGALFDPLVLLALFIPVLALGGAGRFRPRTLAIWLAVAAAVVAVMGWWADRGDAAASAWFGHGGRPWFPMLTFPACVALLFIAHHLILAADIARRRIAPYPVYFDTAWKAGVQLALSAAFTGVFWLLLLLGSGLFSMIGLDFLRTLIGQEWFSIPATTLAFAAAVHLTDVKDGLIRGVRTVALMLLSWLLPVMAILTAGFIAALPFAGVGRLWEAGYGTNLMLAAAGALIILINAAYQDGEPDGRPHPVLQWTARLAAVLLVPLMGLALWGMALRIGQHGLTPERIIALTLVLLGVIYAGGYAFAAVRPGPWMRPLERVNVIAAVAAVVAILALFTPVADPLRLSVGDQVRRLETGRVSAEAFDYRFLRFDAGRAGRRALDRLAESDDPEIAQRAKEAQAAEQRWELSSVERPASEEIRIEVSPTGAVLPPGFLDQMIDNDWLSRRCNARNICQARMVDMDGDGADELLVAYAGNLSGMLLFKLEGDGLWIEHADYESPRATACAQEQLDPRNALRDGRIETITPQFPDLLIEGARIRPQGVIQPFCSDTENPVSIP